MTDVDEFTCLIENHPCADNLSRRVALVLDLALRKKGIGVGRSIPNTHPVWENMREIMLACGLAVAEPDGLYSQFTPEAKSWYDRLGKAGFYSEGERQSKLP